jgi:hypothetical protein
LPTEEDREFVEKAKTVGHIQKYKPGSTHSTPVVREDDGTVGGRQIEHHSGRVDAEVTPRPITPRARTQGDDS